MLPPSSHARLVLTQPRRLTNGRLRQGKMAGLSMLLVGSKNGDEGILRDLYGSDQLHALLALLLLF